MLNQVRNSSPAMVKTKTHGLVLHSAPRFLVYEISREEVLAMIEPQPIKFVALANRLRGLRRIRGELSSYGAAGLT